MADDDRLPGEADKVYSPGAWPPQLNVRSALLTSIFALLLLYALSAAAEILVPLVLALLFSLVFSPLVKKLQHLRIPAVIGALVAVLTLVGMIGTGAYFLSEPATAWMKDAPVALKKVERKVSGLRKPLADIQAAADSVGKLAENGSRADVVQVKVQESTFIDTLINAAPTTLATFATVVVLMYFMLASGDQFLRRLVEQIPKFRDKKAAVETIRAIQGSLSTYLYTITLINFTLGVVTAVSMYLLHVPNPVLWGALAALLNFAPYVGPLIMAGVLLLVGLSSFESIPQAVIPSCVFLVLTTLEGQFLTPLITGRSLSLNPVAIILTIVFLGWMWGVVGVLIAVPVLVCMKIIFERTEMYKPFAAFLERYPSS
ncbi:MAG TPA: AI-2E family transporter [Woeseiaceae bacterium]|nr:AI-2E family transporter [Woeseiaceae bacterium]